MPKIIETVFIAVVVVIAALYLYRRIRASVSGRDSMDCPFANQCDGCSCKKPELKDKCGIAGDDKTCGCG